MPNADTFGCGLRPAAATRFGPNGPAAAQLKFAAPPVPLKVHWLVLRVLAGKNPVLLLRKEGRSCADGWIDIGLVPRKQSWEYRIRRNRRERQSSVERVGDS